MFDQIKKLREMQKKMKSIAVEEELNGVTVKMDGMMKVTEVKIESPEDKKLAKNVRKAFNNAMKKVQKQMQKDMMGSGGGLSGLMG
jgi:DNA-binding protein YbaB